MDPQTIGTVIGKIIGLSLIPFLFGFIAYLGVRLANKWVGPISIRMLPPKD